MACDDNAIERINSGRKIKMLSLFRRDIKVINCFAGEGEALKLSLADDAAEIPKDPQKPLFLLLCPHPKHTTSPE
jgi:hypothetical protein